MTDSKCLPPQEAPGETWDERLVGRLQQLKDAGCESLTILQMCGLVAFVRSGEGGIPAAGSELERHIDEGFYSSKEIAERRATASAAERPLDAMRDVIRTALIDARCTSRDTTVVNDGMTNVLNVVIAALASHSPAGSDWQLGETAPRDGTTFYATLAADDFETSSHWALFWNGEFFECCSSGFNIQAFDYWMKPAFPSTKQTQT